MTKCIIDNCVEEISPRSRLAVCRLCRCTLYRWMKVPVACVRNRVTNLAKYSSRMELVESKRGIK